MAFFLFLRECFRMPKDRNDERGSNECLTEAIHHLSRQIEKFGEQAHQDNQTMSILCRLDQKIENIMSAISDFAAKQKSFNDRQGAAIDAAVTSVTGLTEDVAELNRKITELQNSAGTVTPEDQLLINDLETQGDAVATKLEAVASALSALDAQTPPVVPPVTP